MCSNEENAYLIDLKENRYFLKPNEEFTIGRYLRCSLTIEDLRISRMHCKFKEVDGFWGVFDESINGTWVNNNRIKRCEKHNLSDGDVIKLCDDLEFKFVNHNLLVNVEHDKLNTVKSEKNVSNETSEKIECDGKQKCNTDDLGEGTSSGNLCQHEVGLKLPETVESELQCSICTELFIKAQTLNCSHTFCKMCINEWKKKNKICPICRANIKTITPTLILDNLVDSIIQSSSEDVKQSRKRLCEDRENSNNEKSKKPKTKNSPVSRNTRSRSATNTINLILISSDEDENDNDDEDEIEDTEGEEELDSWMYDVEVRLDPDYMVPGMSDYMPEYVRGDPGVYYGGYGTCYRCGARGHWANGCPLRLH